MRLVPSSALLAATLCVAGIACAANSDVSRPRTHYRWHDAQGGLHFGDSIPPGEVRFGYDIVNDQGLVVRHVDREMTPQERAAAAAEAARIAAAKRAAQQQALADQQLLAAYPTAAELHEAQQARLAQMQQGIKTTQSNLHTQEQDLADLLAQAAEMERSGKPVPPYLRKRVAEQRKIVAGERDQVTQMQHDREQTARKLDAELQRYRALRAKEQGEMGG